jgi:hypothetical protein
VNLGGKIELYDFVKQEEFIMQHLVKEHHNSRVRNKQYKKVLKRHLVMYLILIAIKTYNQIKVSNHYNKTIIFLKLI